MGSTTDKIKGRVKEAVGVITDNDRLKREGQTDQVVGEVKATAEVAPQLTVVSAPSFNQALECM